MIQVKGLFCAVPRECLEHLIVYGFSSPSLSSATGSSSLRPRVLGADQGGVFKDSWFQVRKGAVWAVSPLAADPWHSLPPCMHGFWADCMAYQVPRSSSTASFRRRGGSSRATASLDAAQDHHQQALGSGVAGEGGYASLMARAARPVAFPRCFSR